MKRTRKDSISESLVYLYKRIDEKHNAMETENEVLRMLNDRCKANESTYKDKIKSLEREVREKTAAQLRLTEEKGNLNLQICQLTAENSDLRRQLDFLLKVNDENNDRRKNLRRSHNELMRRVGENTDLHHILSAMQENLKG